VVIPKGAESKTNGENSTLGLVAVAAERAAVYPGTRGNGENRIEIQDIVKTHKNEDKSMVLLRVNCRKYLQQILRVLELS